MSPVTVNGGDSLPPVTVMVVQYLETPISQHLLCKFPDNSAFDFDCAQSSIWSPLLLRPPSKPSSAGGVEFSRRISFGGTSDRVGLLDNTKKMARKFTDAVFENVSKCIKTKRRKRTSCGLSPAGSGRRPSSSSSSPKGWTKLMKAAVKQFKKKNKAIQEKEQRQNLHLYLKL